MEMGDIHLLAFNPGSLKGKVKGELVYANYGFKTDFKKLQDKSVNLENTIAIIKYGGGYIPEYKKLQIAKSFGVIGVIFISDPKLSNAYNLNSIQKEPVASPDFGSGNIMDPGFGADDTIPDYFDTDKLLEASSATAALPSIPISWKDFLKIMEFNNKDIPDGDDDKHFSEWDVEIDSKKIEIHNNKKIQMELDLQMVERPQKEMWNVVGRLPGSEQGGMAIVIGASRDGSCYGTSENSGTAVLLELVNLFTQLSHDMSWKPLRSIFFASFSGTQYNLAGTTFFAGNRREDLKRMAVSFINLDDLISGDEVLKIDADPLLHDAIRETLRQHTVQT
ncbi:unnamed protein product [Ambrosiozyma monospora]|uniref:Unnamed protein product n=1 Tax=Ambrosiozyma monospora TaxID=43982 RepID=A0ACB5TUC6_AMBMO|nr:unnamed protein product [Ambrosiozyma monospora]